MIVGACGGHGQVATDAYGTGTDAAPLTCPVPVTEDSADHSTVALEQLIVAPSSATGTTILVLGMLSGSTYASLNGYFKITGLPPSHTMNIFLVMGTACTPACSPMVELRAGFHPDIKLLGDDLMGGCTMSNWPSTDPQGELQLFATPTNDGPNYGYLIQIP
jgi:hypothetical protein